MTEVSPEERSEPKVSSVAYVLYYLVLFFAYWFGSARFDFDGDGDFDPTDVEAYLNNKGFLTHNFHGKKKKPKGGHGSSTAQVKPKPPAAGAGYLDSNGDGEVDFMDAFETAVVEGDAAEDQMFQTQRPPYFIITECLVAFGFWAYFAGKHTLEGKGNFVVVKAGLDSLQEGKFDLRIHDDTCNDFRLEVWRWLSYQFTHVGAMHILMNCFLNVMLGVPLEGLHGTFKLFVMFNIGVFGGACCFFFNDSHTAVVGMSGGCYALIGMHVGNVVMNWDQLKFRKPILLFLCLLVACDVLSYVLALGAENASHSAHIGGAVAGTIIGILIGDNIKVTRMERVVQMFFLLVGVGLVVFSLTWLAIMWPPNNIWGDVGWCWMRQVWKYPMPDFECVRCGTQDCINSWHAWAGNYIDKVNFQTCNTRGWYGER
mmetsp:Transcript_64646/g.169252  ORF Transcript_64646/g.169252 Transcript_64646/m.169252 type:complete len:427 (+) Transcript_64646:97-1377(+)